MRVKKMVKNIAIYLTLLIMTGIVGFLIYASQYYKADDLTITAINNDYSIEYHDNYVVIGGHSLGGAMASSYASEHKDKIDGVVLLGAYIYGDYPKDKSITIYGENDNILNRSKINYTENVYMIEGGNHGQFGNYGHQKGDGISTITSDEQQDETVTYIFNFIRGADKSTDN